MKWQFMMTVMLFLSAIFMTVMIIIASKSQAHEAVGANRDYHEQLRTRNDNNDDILIRAASDTDEPVNAKTRTTVIQRDRRPHIPHKHEWEAWASVSNSDNDYKVTSWYATATAKDDTQLPRSENNFQYDGEFDYSVTASDEERGVKDVTVTINDCSAQAWINAEKKKKCKNNPETASAWSFVPFHDPNFPGAE